MTPLSPLQLKSHFFTRFSVHANEAGTITGPQNLEPTISFEKNAQAPNQWALTLGVVLKSAKPETPTLYEADLEMFGIVEVNNGFPPERMEQLAVVNGLSLLYSAIREMFLTVTARCAHGALTLPVLSFVEMLAKPSAPNSVSTPAKASTHAENKHSETD